ncbi:hypothetical protein [Pseudanabaena sp. FACHB-2040]|uniref:hypothetical protein n=1 Tax=Pseudanabaena sp. FACHB-2040 TaxID=2692859 RepID=UPI0016846776|nr:hypothetical protein [Pseudanabaena sp. FACHB-2040]MBD2258788.1 hypothetical protein [Pseudanabaena sp. FACHB-2040]
MSPQNPEDQSIPPSTFNPEELQSKEVKDETLKKLEQNQVPTSGTGNIDPDEIARSADGNKSAFDDTPDTVAASEMGVMTSPD